MRVLSVSPLFTIIELILISTDGNPDNANNKHCRRHVVIVLILSIIIADADNNQIICSSDVDRFFGSHVYKSLRMVRRGGSIPTWGRERGKPSPFRERVCGIVKLWV